MPEQKPTVVLSTDVERNAVKIADADRVKTARANKAGRFYLSRDLGGEWVEFAVKRGGIVADGDPEESGDVLLHDVELLTRKRVLGNGHLHLGKPYHNAEVTVALNVVDVEDPEKEQHGNRQTARS